ncbi:MAG: hypothetical protein ACJ0GV_00405 [Dehalococcoidia bacterium]|tara:strand:- start:557 stop:937 length:381 start_codon:yes stop_codon:yes gene_type:complete
MKKRIYAKKNYKRLSGFDRSLIMGLIITSIDEKSEVNRKKIHNYLEKNKNYIELVKNLGFVNSDILRKQYESLIDNNLRKLINYGVVKIDNNKNYHLTSHGEELRVKYSNEWLMMPNLKKLMKQRN